MVRLSASNGSAGGAQGGSPESATLSWMPAVQPPGENENESAPAPDATGYEAPAGGGSGPPPRLQSLASFVTSASRMAHPSPKIPMPVLCEATAVSRKQRLRLGEALRMAKRGTLVKRPTARYESASRQVDSLLTSTPAALAPQALQ